MEALSEKIETAADLRDFIDVEAVMKNVADNDTDTRREVLAQIAAAGIQATDEAIDDLVAQLDQQVANA